MENTYKFYSTITKQVYDTKEELFAAEKEVKQKHAEEEAKREERKLRAKEVEDAFKRVEEAKKEAQDLLTQFCKDYGSYHASYTEQNNPFRTFFQFPF